MKVDHGAARAAGSRSGTGPPHAGLSPDGEDALALFGDPGDDYAQAPRRWVQPWPGTVSSAWIVVGAIIVGFLLASGATAGRSAARVQDERKAQLIALIAERMDRTEVLGARLEELRATVAAAEAEAASGLPVLRAQVADSEARAGLTRVRGPGLRVTLADASGPCGALPENCRIQDADLQMAVNALFAAGAEAVAVNGERIISTSALRSAGRSILVNYRVLTGPYVIDAVGEREALAERLAASDFAADFALWRDEYGLGYGVVTLDELDLPAYAGSVRMRVATAAEDAP